MKSDSTEIATICCNSVSTLLHTNIPYTYFESDYADYLSSRVCKFWFAIINRDGRAVRVHNNNNVIRNPRMSKDAEDCRVREKPYTNIPRVQYNI